MVKYQAYDLKHSNTSGEHYLQASSLSILYSYKKGFTNSFIFMQTFNFILNINIKLNRSVH